jgi:hypothetical protein
MAGPIDTRIQPTRVNMFAKSKSINWFEANLINYVPIQCKGAFRKVYPGFVQLVAFVSMNLERHIKHHLNLASHLAKGEKEKADVIKRRIFRRDGPAGGILHRNGTRRISGASPATGPSHASRAAGESRRDRAHGADDGGR